jgi:hypothetical protein
MLLSPEKTLSAEIFNLNEHSFSSRSIPAGQYLLVARHGFSGVLQAEFVIIFNIDQHWAGQASHSVRIQDTRGFQDPILEAFGIRD